MSWPRPTAGKPIKRGTRIRTGKPYYGNAGLSPGAAEGKYRMVMVNHLK